MGERETAPSWVASPASRRELYDHARAMLAYARLYLREPIGVGGRGFVVIAHMDVD